LKQKASAAPSAQATANSNALWSPNPPELPRETSSRWAIGSNRHFAFAAARAKRPELELYQPDKRHPSLAGTYLAASTVYATVFGKSPVGLSYTAGLDPELAAFLQAVAWETVQSYLKK